MIQLDPLTRDGMIWAQCCVTAEHYLHRPVDVRTMPEGYAVRLMLGAPYHHLLTIGVLLFGRPEATRCYPWYGSVDDVATGRAEVTRWQVLNLSRVYLDPRVQIDGELFGSEHLPGYRDRGGRWRSTLASTVIRLAMERVRLDYLLRRPPCFLEEPYELRYLMSYCDTRIHRGTIYAASGFELYRTNRAGIQTWRIPLAPLTAQDHNAIRCASEINLRAIRFRGKRAQLALGV